MNNTERREEIIRLLSASQVPLSGSRLASLLGVSRQIIVQDVALLRTRHPILATAQGYLLYDIPKNLYCRSFLVRHTAEQIFDELSTIVREGGRVLDVIVEHDVYGQIRADLNLYSAADVERFCSLLEKSSSGPLFPISAGIHIHTVQASSEEALDRIARQLAQKGYLLEGEREPGKP